MLVNVVGRQLLALLVGGLLAFASWLSLVVGRRCGWLIVDVVDWLSLVGWLVGWLVVGWLMLLVDCWLAFVDFWLAVVDVSWLVVG